MQLDLSPRCALPEHEVVVVFSLRRGRRQRGAEVPALRNGQDPTVADWAHGPKNALQRVRREVQVWAAGARVQARREPNVCSDEALEFAPQGAGAAAAEGNGEGPAPAASVSPIAASAEHDVRCPIIQR